MNFLIAAFNAVLYQPFFNALILLYSFLPGHDFGVAIILLTVFIRILLYPLMAHSIRSQKAFAVLQPKLQEIQKKHKDDKAKQAKELMALYQKEKINPLSGFLSLFAQIPILIALYQVFWKGLKPEAMSALYSFVPNPGQVSPFFLGAINLVQPSQLLAVLAGLAQFYQSWHQNKYGLGQANIKKDVKTDHFSAMFQKQALYFFPIFTVFILWGLPSAVGLYWVTTTLFSILQQQLILKGPPKGVVSPQLTEQIKV